MCTCQERVEKNLTEHFTKQLPDSTDVKAALKGYAICFGKTVESKPFMVVEATHTTTAKKTGLQKQKTEKTNMFFNFCPWCGAALRGDESAQKNGGG